jgi:hypothetical protein
VTKRDPGEYLPTSVQKSYFMLSRSARAILDTALRKYRLGRTDLIPIGGIGQLKPALRLMTAYRLMIREVTGGEVVTEVRGDSMIDAHIVAGDVVIMELRDPTHRDIVAALIDGETTLKRFLVHKGKPFLRAENSKYPDLIPAHELVIQGVFRALLRVDKRRL